MIFLFSFFIFLFGTAIGSFLNVVILRTEKKQSLDGRSHCPNCKHQLSVLDLMPILSYLTLRGKCRYCSHKLSAQYPLVEFFSAVVFTLISLQTFPWQLVTPENIFSIAIILPLLKLLFNFFVAAVLIVVSVYDLKTGLIPDKIILPASLLAFGFLVINTCFKVILHACSLETGNFVDIASLKSILLAFSADILTTVVIAGFFFLLIMVTKGKGMGGGDFKLSIFIGLAIGWPLALLAIFLGFLTGAFGSVMLILLGKKTIKQAVPFGPFLALGSLFAIVYGKEILELYLRSMGL